MVRKIASSALVIVLALVFGGCGKKDSSSCANPTAPSCGGGGGGDTAQIQNVELSIPSGTVLEGAQNIPYLLSLAFDLPTTEYATIASCMSVEADILTNGCGRYSSRDVSSWRRENPIRLEAYCACAGWTQPLTFKYLHIFVLRGRSFPSVSPGTSVGQIRAMQNFLDHREMEWTITILPKR